MSRINVDAEPTNRQTRHTPGTACLSRQDKRSESLRAKAGITAYGGNARSPSRLEAFPAVTQNKQHQR
jgi:hypothetical protein